MGFLLVAEIAVKFHGNSIVTILTVLINTDCAFFDDFSGRFHYSIFSINPNIYIERRKLEKSVTKLITYLYIFNKSGYFTIRKWGRRKNKDIYGAEYLMIDDLSTKVSAPNES